MMKRTNLKNLLMLSFLLCVVACKGQSPEAVKGKEKKGPIYESVPSVPIKILDGYFLKNTYNSQSETAFFIFQNQEPFDNYIGIASTMGKTIEKPDFNKNIVVAIASKPIQVKTEIVVSRCDRVKENTVNVYFEIQKGEKLTYTMQPLLLFYFEKHKGVNFIDFIQNGQVVKELSLSRRAAGAPKSIDDLKKNFIGTFSGTLPCADCEGIETKLTLNVDYTFTMESVYKGKGDGKPIVEKGKWTPSEDLAMIELNYDQKDSFYYALVDKNTLEKLDNDARTMKNSSNYRLMRK